MRPLGVGLRPRMDEGIQGPPRTSTNSRRHVAAEGSSGGSDPKSRCQASDGIIRVSVECRRRCKSGYELEVRT